MKSIRFGFVFFTLLASFSVISGCTNESKNSPEYDFDEVLHFEFIGSKSPVPYDSLLGYEIDKMLYTPLPNELDRYLPDYLIKLQFSCDTIPESDFEELNSIFIFETIEDNLQTECVPVYRDLLFFRKNNDVVKIAQLCFQCEQSHFVGAWPNMISFGQRGEFDKLEKLLNK